MKYVHKDTTLGTIRVAKQGLEVPCTVTVLRMSDRGPISEHSIEFLFQNLNTDHEAGMQPLIAGALAKGRALAASYIAARVEA